MIFGSTVIIAYKMAQSNNNKFNAILQMLDEEEEIHEASEEIFINKSINNALGTSMTPVVVLFI